ncbi:MAG: hypothetical protein JETT_0365 [Candidatus Jettenia ecosi]|uniref:Uncharacterized protein n=1 Tax=Candidatus Jettenia ecosi TaxID=2494326 RepID=A0A533QRW9_9BACT|nr:MAG: hypothetical protein JETT_0365 [Candidatus Jettenia ecosi]
MRVKLTADDTERKSIGKDKNENIFFMEISDVFVSSAGKLIFMR